MAATSIFSRRLIDRRPQLDLLTERFAAARKGEGSYVIIGGEAGSGKSRLVSEFCAGLTRTASRLAIGRSLEYVQSPFAPFLAALVSLVSDDPAVMGDDILSAIAPLVPELRYHASTNGERDRLRQFNAISEAFRRFGEAKPTIVVLEDFQWADSASLELLLHMSPYVSRSQLLLIVTFRSDEPRRDNQLRSTLAKLRRAREVHYTELTRLTDPEMHELIYHAVGGLQMPSGAAAAICARAEGNPLFAEELLKGIAQDTKGRHSLALPTTLQEAVRDRAAMFDEQDRTMLIQASAIGRRFKADFLSHISQAELSVVLATLKKAINSQFLIEEKEGSDVFYAFRHELVREALYNELLTEEARSLHQRIASAIESSDHTDSRASELAYHYRQAGESQKAAHYSERAGDSAFDFFAYNDAVEAYEHALRGTTAGEHRAELHQKLANALHQCGQGERAVHAMEAALAYYDQIGDIENAALTCLRMAVEYLTLADSERHLRLNERALSLVGDNPRSPAFLLAHVQLIDHYTSYHWDPDKARQHLAEAERATGARSSTEVNLLEFRSILAIGLGQPHEALAHTQRAADLAAAQGDFRSVLRAWGTYSGIMGLAGERLLASEGFDRALQLMDKKNIGGLTAYWTLIYMAYQAFHAGELETARTLVTRLLGSGTEMRSFLVHLAGVGIPVGLALDDEELVDRCAREDLLHLALRSSSAMYIGATSGFAERLAARDELSQARELLEQSLAALECAGGIPPWDAHRLFVTFAHYGNETDLARMEAILERSVSSASARSSPPVRSLFKAYLAARRNDQGSCVTLASEAAAQFHEIGWPLWEAEALELSGREREAYEIYERTGAVRDIARLGNTLMPTNRRGRKIHELTSREQEILDLLASGKSNRSIGEALVISERTVEKHISSILSKLGASSRGQLIAQHVSSKSVRGSDHK